VIGDVPAAPAAIRTRARVGMLALISLAVATNYLDRAVLGIAAPAVQREYTLSPAVMGVVFSAFSWTYFLGQVPSGALLDRFGTRAIYAVSLFGWSLVTLLHSLTAGFASLFGLRLALGVAEAPCFPANSNVVAIWFPRSERGRAIGVYTAAEYVGLGFMSPILFWILNTFGWRALFVSVGTIGVVLAGVFALRYRDPADHPTVSQAELAYVRAGGGEVGPAPPTRFSLAHVRALFRHRQMWGLCIGQYAVYSTFVFFLTWFPTYLASERHMAWIQVGFFTALPYIAGFFGILFAGWWSDFMLARGRTLNAARKLPVIAGLLGASTIAAANYVQSDRLVIAILSVAFFAQAMSSSGWTVISEVSPRAQLGLVSGFFSASANLSGIVTPVVIGGILQATGSFYGALAFVGGVALVGALAWIFLIGDIKPMDLGPAAAVAEAVPSDLQSRYSSRPV
jgi:ACS family D-galactonate transporter-like MFS transporter